jgi:hypothetical protein
MKALETFVLLFLRQIAHQKLLQSVSGIHGHSFAPKAHAAHYATTTICIARHVGRRCEADASKSKKDCASHPFWRETKMKKTEERTKKKKKKRKETQTQEQKLTTTTGMIFHDPHRFRMKNKQPSSIRKTAFFLKKKKKKKKNKQTDFSFPERFEHFPDFLNPHSIFSLATFQFGFFASCALFDQETRAHTRLERVFLVL